jgi:hypothetical protein
MKKKMNIITALCLVIAAAGCAGSIQTLGDSGTVEDAPPDDGQIDALAEEPAPDVETDPAADPPEDADAEEPAEDNPPDTAVPQCSDGIDNDGDSLVDMEDFDCIDPSDPVEGPETGECTNDSHCDAGWNECDLTTNTCYDPPQHNICEDCWSSQDCGDGVSGEDPNRDFCVYVMIQRYCAKDCRNDFDCPRAFICDFSQPAGLCVPYAGTCASRASFGSACSNDGECNGLQCPAGICTSDCRVEHDCPDAMSCIESLCILD